MEGFPQQENKENVTVSREEVIQSLIPSTEGEFSREKLIQWMDQNQEQIRTIEDKREEIRANAVFEIDLAKLYMEAGYPEQAWNSLTGLDTDIDDVHNYSAYGEGVRTMADSLGHEDLVQEIDALIKELEAKL